MRIFITILLNTVFVCNILSQHISIEYSGAPLTKGNRQHIEQFLKHAVNLYSQFGLPSDTINVRLNIFDDKKEWRKFIITKDARYKEYSILPQGIANIKANECHIMLYDGMKSINLGTIRHEVSHFLTKKTLKNILIPWLDEGLSEYFQHCDVTKKGLKHSLETYEKGRLRTMLMLKEIELEDIFEYKYSEFLHDQLTNDQITYIASHAIVTFLIEKTPQDYFCKLITVLKDKNDKNSTLQKIDRTYPGGWKQFKEDFISHYK